MKVYLVFSDDQGHCIKTVKNKKKLKKFEWKYTLNKTYYVGNCYIDNLHIADDKAHLQNGRYRVTEKVANDALELQRNMMKLHALIEQVDIELGITCEADWEDSSQEKYYIFYNNISCRYEIDYVFSKQNIGVPYCCEKTARRVQASLNNGEVEL